MRRCEGIFNCQKTSLACQIRALIPALFQPHRSYTTRLAMVALPDVADLRNSTAVERQARHALRGQATMKRALHMAVGSACLMAAVGVWGFQPGAGDAAMQLIKLLVSAVLLITGMILISGLRDRVGPPELHVDPMNRQVRIVEFDGAGRARIAATHDFDGLSRLDLKDGFLTAHDGDGKKLFAVPVNDPDVVEALRAAI